MTPFDKRFLPAFAGVIGALSFGSSSLACTPTTNSTSNIGPYSPAAVKASVVPALSNFAGLNCSTAVLIILGSNRIRATFTSANNFKLKPPTGTDVINYTASADSGATVAITQGATIDYMQNNLLNILGLLGGSSANMPFYLKPTSTSLVAAGTYTDTITIAWDWDLCTGIGAFGACIGTHDHGTATTYVVTSLTVTPKPPTVSIASAVTWDPLNGTVAPKAVPGGKQRMTASIANPDIATLRTDTVVVSLPTPSGMAVALDGDGLGGSVIQLTQGSPASGLTLTYTSGASTTDDVDFSNDNGATWTYSPSAASDLSMAAVTHVRLRFKGSMAANSAFTASVPYKVK